MHVDMMLIRLICNDNCALYQSVHSRKRTLGKQMIMELSNVHVDAFLILRILSRLVSSALSWIYLSVHRVTRHACRIKHWWEGTCMWASISVLLVRMRCRNCRLCRNGYREVNWSWVICCGVFRQFWSDTRWNLASSCGNRKRVAGENATTLYRYFRHHSLFRNRTARSAIFN